MMNCRFGVENFRKFKRLEPLQLANVTYLVGENNSGKSSFHKGYMLMIDNLKSFNIASSIPNPIFRLDSKGLFHLHLGTLSDIAYKDPKQSQFSSFANGKNMSGTIKLSLSNNGVEYVFHVGESYKAYIKKAELIWLNYALAIDFKEGNLHIRLYDDGKKVTSIRVSYNTLRSIPDTNISIFYYALSLVTELIDGIDLSSRNERNNLEFPKQHDSLIRNRLNNHNAYSVLKNTNDYWNSLPDTERERLANSLLTYTKEYDSRSSFEEWLNNDFVSTVVEIHQYISSVDYEYIYAHVASSRGLFHSENGDYLSKTINEFYQTGAYNNSNVVKEIRFWLQKFEIGSSFTIELFQGEYYNVMIDSQNIQYKGLGVRQLFTILLRVGCIMNTIYPEDMNSAKSAKTGPTNETSVGKNALIGAGVGAAVAGPFGALTGGVLGGLVSGVKSLFSFDKENYTAPRKVLNTTLIFEEPEQNLHPKLQSLLSDFFLYISNKLRCSIIVETHSEYLIRKCQVHISEKELTATQLDDIHSNPYKIYYFPSDKDPYSMIFRPDGKFRNSFGPGFFDEAGNLALKLF